MSDDEELRKVKEECVILQGFLKEDTKKDNTLLFKNNKYYYLNEDKI